MNKLIFKHDTKKGLMIALWEIGKGNWMINRFFRQPTRISDDGTVLDFDIEGGKGLIFYRDVFTKEIGKDTLYFG